MKQETAFDILKLGHNVFLTGPAGSGKTYLLDKFIKYLRRKGVGVAVTASTGIAATHLNGITIHSWCGMGVRDKLTPKDLKKLSKNYRIRKRMRNAQVLVIDEVSMIHAFQLDMIDELCRLFKDPFLPFGGLQLVLCGDMFQLPPVGRGEKKYAIQSSAWEKADIKICYLEGLRRTQDRDLIKVLNDIRCMQAGKETLKLIETRRNQKIKGVSRLTRLYSHNINVDTINQAELMKIEGKALAYCMHCDGPDKLVDSIKKGCLAHERLVLKIGALVMFIKNNFEEGYVNGTIGEVVDFDDMNLPIVRTKTGRKITVEPAMWEYEEDGNILSYIKQLPLRLAWAITIHKSQGMTLDAVEIDLSQTFEYGMGYVALSRARDLKSIRVLGINSMALEVDPHVSEVDKEMIKLSKIQEKGIKKIGALKRIKLIRDRMKELSSQAKLSRSRSAKKSKNS